MHVNSILVDIVTSKYNSFDLTDWLTLSIGRMTVCVGPHVLFLVYPFLTIIGTARNNVLCASLRCRHIVHGTWPQAAACEGGAERPRLRGRRGAP